MDCQDAIRAIIRREYHLMGGAAHRIAATLDFITIDKYGTLAIEEEPTWDHVQTLIDTYAALQGTRVAVGIANHATDDERVQEEF